MSNEDEKDACGSGGVYSDTMRTQDKDLDAVLLFADVDWTDPEAVARRKAEWKALTHSE